VADFCGTGVAACTTGGLREDAREVGGFGAGNVLREEACCDVGSCIIAEDGLRRPASYEDVGGSLGPDCGLDEVHGEVGDSLVGRSWLHEEVRGEFGGNVCANKGLREEVRGEVGGGVDIIRRRALLSLRVSWHSVPVLLLRNSETSLH